MFLFKSIRSKIALSILPFACLKSLEYYFKTMNNIKCPHCGKQVEISEALKHEVTEKEIEKIKLQLATKAKEDASIEIERIKKEGEEDKNRIKELNERIDKLLDEIRKERVAKEEAEINAKKKLMDDEEKIRKEEQQKSRLEILERDKKINDMQQALDEAKKKGKQSSQQLQGEVMELDLENQLKNAFSYDEFLPIPKGIEGADIWQKVKNKHGQEAGSILWEIKKTKLFSKGWLPKLREDCRKISASVSILITDALPDGIEYFGRENGIWISSFEYAIVLASVLRDSLLQLAIAKSGASHKDEHLQEIYEYITSEQFRHKIEAHFESVRTLRVDLDTERRAMERIWKKREVEIQRLDRSMSQMFGEIQGVAGPKLEPPKNLEIDPKIEE